MPSSRARRRKVRANAADYDAAKENRVSSQVLDKVPDDNIVNEYVNDTGSINTQNLGDFRQATEYHGVAVSASGTNKSITVATNRSAVGEGVADSGNIVVNTLGGATTAMVDKAQIESKKDVTVAAHDYASDSSVLGTLDGSLPADSRGRASNTTTNSRETIAKVQGLGRTADIRARNFEVEALALHGIANFDVGVSGSSVGVASVNDVTLLKGKTKAGVRGTNAALSGDFAVRADNASRLYRQTLASGGDGVAAGLAVAVVKGESETEAALQGSKIAFSQDGTSKADVSAKNDTQNHYKQLSPSDGAVAAAGSVGVSNFNDTVKTRLQDATIGAETLRARQIDVKAENRTLAETGAYKENGRANVGVGVNVATLDNQIETSIKGGALFSKDSLTVAANEQRKISLDTMNFGTSAGGNTLNTTVVTAGHEVEDEYKANADGSRTTVTANVGKAYKDANEAIRKGTLKKEHTFGIVSADAAVVEAGRGGKKSQVATAIKDARLSAGENLSVTSKEVNDLNVLGVNAALQGMAVNGSFSAANVARNAFLDVENSNLEGKSVEAAATIGGESKIRAIQGSIPLAPAAAAVSIGDWDGEVRARVKGGSLRATDGAITVHALDEAKTETLAAANGGAAAEAVLLAASHAHTATAVDAGGALDAADKNIELKANRIDLTDGSLTGKTVVVEAADAITQANTEKSAVRASDKASFTVGTAGKAGGSIHMLSEKNTFGKADVRAADEAAGLIGNVDLVTNAASGLTVNFGAGSAGTLKVKGSSENPLGVRVKNIAENQSLTLEGKLQALDTDMAFTSGGSLTLKSGAEYTSARNMALTAQEDVTLERGAKLDAENLRLEAGKSVFAAGSLQINGSIAAEGKDIEMKQKVTAGKDLTLTGTNSLTTEEELSAANITLAGGDVTVQKEAKAGNNLTLTGGNVTTQKKVNAGKDLTMTGTNSLKTADEVSAANITLTGGDITTQKKVTAGNDMTLTAANSLKATDKLTAGGSIAASSENGNIDLAAVEATGGIDLKATNGKLTAAVLQAQGSIAAAGKDVEMKQKVTAGNDMTMTAVNSLTTEAEISADQNMKLTGGDVTTQKKVNAGNDMTLTANGKLTAAVLQAQGSIAAAGKDVEMKQQVTAGKDLTMTAANSLTTEAEISAEQNMKLTGGDITTQKKVTAGSNLTMTAANKLTTADEVSAANITLTGGDVTAQKKVNAGSDLTMTAANSLTTTDKLTAGSNIAASSANGNIDLAAAEAKGGIDLKATNGKLTAEALQAQGSIAVAGKDVEMKNQVIAGKDLTMTGTNKLTTADELSAANITLSGGDITTAKKVNADRELTMTATKSLKTEDEVSAANITLKGGDITTQKKVNAGKDLTLTAANSLTTTDKLTAGGNIAASSANGNMDIAAAEAKGGIDLKATNGKLTAEALQAQGSIAVAGKDVEMKNQVIAGKDLTMTGTNKLTTADELSAANITLSGGDITTAKKVNADRELTMTATKSLKTEDEVSAANITLKGGDITTQKKVNAGKDLTLTAANSLTTTDKLTAGGNIAASSANGNMDIAAAEATGGIDLKATNGKLTAAALQAKANIAAAGKDVAMKTATAGSDLTMTATNSLTSADKLEAGGLVNASQIGGNGDIALHNVKAGSFYAEHSGTGDLRADDVYSHSVGFVHHEGVGDIHLDKMQVGDTARISHTGTGDIFTRYLLAGREAHFLNNNGGMDLGVADGGRRLTIQAPSEQAKVRANVLRASELLTIFALHQEIDQFEAPVRLDLIHSGDQARRAVDWRGAAELGSLFETYWRRYEPVGAESFIDLRSWESAFSESVESNETGEEAVTIGEDA